MTKIIGSAALAPGGDSGFDLDEKGQIHGYSDTQFALPVGSDNSVLTSLASEASGLKWSTSLALAGGITSIPVGIDQFAKCEHLGTYRATTTEQSKDFTGLSQDMDGAYSRLKLVISGGLSSDGAATLNAFVDSRTSGGAYNFNYLAQDSGTVSGTNSSNQDTILLLPSGILESGAFFTAELDIMYSGTNSNVMFYEWWAGSTEEGVTFGNGHCSMTSGGSTIDAVGFSASENWLAGTQADLYGYKL